MADLPYFPFYPADWISSPRIMCLTLAQQGAYMRLLCACWMSGDCSLPDDHQKLSMISGLPVEEVQTLGPFLGPHPTKTGHITNERLMKEWEKAHWISDMRSQAGKKSGKSRRTSVQQKHEQSSNKIPTNSDKSEVRSQTHNSESEVRSQKSEVKIPVSASPHGNGKSVETWESYKNAYVKRYGVEPVRNQQGSAMLCKLIDKIGQDAPSVAAFYLTHNDQFYVRKRHPINLLLGDAEGLRTQWATGVKATSVEAKNAEVKDNVVEQVKRVEALMKGRAV